MAKPSSVSLPEAAIEHMSSVAREHVPDQLKGNFVGTDFEGATIGYSFVTPQGVLPAQDLTVGPGIELPNFPGFGTPVGYIDIFSNSLLVEFYSPAHFPAGGFYGFILTDPYNEIPDITHVTLIENGGSASLTQSDITFSANHVAVNLAGTSFTAGSAIVLDFSFAPSSEHVLGSPFAASHHGLDWWLV